MNIDPIEIEVLLNSTAVAGQSNQLRGALRGVDASVASTERRFKDLTRAQLNAADGNATLTNSFKSLTSAAVAYFSINTASGFVNSLVEIRGEMQKTETAFRVMTGSQELANELMRDSIDLAAKSPFNMKEVAQGAKQLLAFNVPANEVVDTLRRMGDIASAVGVPISQLQLIYGQVRAKTKLMGDELRQFSEAGVPMVSELAKKFKTTEGEIYKMVSAGKIGFADVQEVLFQMTNEGGRFHNMMAEQAKSLSGQYSNLKDAIEQMFNKIGQSQEGVLSAGLSSLTYLVQHYSELLDVLGGIITVYGSYKAAVMLVSAAQEVNNAMMVKEIEMLSFSEKMKIGRLLVTERQAKATLLEAQAELAGVQAKHAAALTEGTVAGKTKASVLAKQIKVATLKVETAQEALGIAAKNASAAAEVRLTAMQQLRAAATRLVTQAQALLNATMLTNPIVLMIAAVGGLIYAYVNLSDSTTEAEKLENKLREQREKHAKVLDELKAKSEQYLAVVRDENATKLQRYEAYLQLQALYPQLLKNIELETFLLMDQAEVQKLLSKGQDEKRKVLNTNEIAQAKEQIQQLKKEIETLEDSAKYAGQGAEGIWRAIAKKNEQLNITQGTLEKNLATQKDIEVKEKVANMTLEQRKAYYQGIAHNLEALLSRKKNTNGEMKKTVGLSAEVERNLRNWDITKLTNSLDYALRQLNAVNSAIGNANKAAADKNKADWEKQKEDAQKAIDAMTGKDVGSEAWNKQKALYNEAEKELKKYDISIKTAAANQNNLEKAAAKAARKAEQFAKRQKELIQEISEAERAFAVSRMQQQDREIANVEDKYKKLKDKAKELKLPTSQLGKIENLEQAEKASVTYKQGTDNLLKDLELQREVYASYEAFKTKVGKEEADKRFEVAKWEFQSFGELIQAEIDKLKSLENLTPEQVERKTKLEEKQKDYNKDKGGEERDKYAEAYTALMSFDDKRRAVEKKYQADRVQLQKISYTQIREAKLAELEYQKQMALDALNTEAYDRATVYERMSANLLGITKRELNSRISSLEEYLSKAEDTLTEEQKLFVKKELEKAKAVRASTSIGVEEKALLQQKEDLLKRITDKQAKGLTNVSEELEQLDEVNAKLKDILAKKFARVSEVAGQLGGAFTELGGALKEYDEGLGDTVETMGELLNVASDVAGAVASFASGDIVGGIMKTIKAITSIFSIGKKARESERKAQEEIKKYHDEIFQAQLNYNAELRKRIADEVKLNDLYKSRVTNIREEMEANRKNREAVVKDQNEIFKRLLRSKTIVGKYDEKYGGFLGIGRKTRVVDVQKSVAEILGIGKWVEKEVGAHGFSFKYKIFEPGEAELTDELFDKLEKLNAEKPLTGDAKAAYDQLKKLRDEYGSLDEYRRQLEKQYKDAITGTTADSLAESIKQGILSGKKAFADFADDIEGFLRNAVLAGLETDIFREKTQKLQDALADMMQDGVITAEEREKFNQLYMAIVEESKQKLDMLNQAGINVIQEQEHLNSLQGAIKGMSQESADIMSGHLAGLRLDFKEFLKGLKNIGAGMMESINKMLEVQMNIEKNTKRTADNTDKLHDISDGIHQLNTKVKKDGTTKGLGF